MADTKTADKGQRREDSTTRQTSSPLAGTNEEKRGTNQESAPGQDGAQTTEDMVRRQGGDSRSEPE